MGTALKLAHGAVVLVADARKALFLVNAGDEVHPHLRTDRVMEAPPNPPSHEQGTQRPGRTHRRAADNPHRSAMEETDWHRQAEAAFAVEVAAALGGAAPLVVVAAPQFLAELRKQMPRPARDVLVAEIASDLTKMPVFEIERHLTAG